MIVTKENGNWLIAIFHNVLFQPLPPGAIIGPSSRDPRMALWPLRTQGADRLPEDILIGCVWQPELRD
jgi:hypothetical protein